MNFYKKMKRFFTLSRWLLLSSTLLCFSVYAFGVHWFNVESIQLSEKPQEENTETNIKWALVIEKYLTNYKKDLLSFQELYWLKNDSILNQNIKEITTMIFWLRKIQTNKIEKSTAEEIMSLYIERLKTLNVSLKKYLQNTAETAKEETKKYQDSLYKNTLSKFSKNLDFIIYILKKRTEGKRILSKSETLYNQKILSLETENKKLKNFNKIFFKNKRELLFSLRNILWKVKKELQAIQTIQ